MNVKKNILQLIILMIFVSCTKKAPELMDLAQYSLDQNQEDDAIEKLFSVYVDGEIDAEIACKIASQFNKDSFLIDLDFDCSKAIQEDLFYDIYGSESEAEICQT